MSSSLFLVVDNIKKSHAIKLIDFAYYGDLDKGKKDENILFGLYNI